MRLAKLAMNPFRIAARSFGESFYQALNPVTPHARCGGCASPQCGANQIGVISGEPDAAVFHGLYDPIAVWRCQR